MLTVKLFHNKISDNILSLVKQALEETYPVEIEYSGHISLPSRAYDTERRQYNAGILLGDLLTRRDIRFLIIEDDIYYPGMNFVFGLAAFYRGAILSTSRLDSDNLIRKEAIHEMGHVFGLKHCTNRCVMKYSNSLWDAKLKPSTLCSECKKQVLEFIDQI